MRIRAFSHELRDWNESSQKLSLAAKGQEYVRRGGATVEAALGRVRNTDNDIAIILFVQVIFRSIISNSKLIDINS